MESNYIFTTKSDGFAVSGSDGGQYAGFTYTWTVNEWVNVVMTQNSTGVEAFVNGISLGTDAGAKFVNQNAQYIGYDGTALSNGYLSELYFVDGHSNNSFNSVCSQTHDDNWQLDSLVA